VQCEWTIRRADINKEIEHIRKGGLASIHLKSKRPGDHPSGEETSLVSIPVPDGAPVLGRYTDSDPSLSCVLRKPPCDIMILN
jgi:hypothetical protein